MAMMKNTGMLWIGQIPVDWELGKVKYAFNRKKEKSILFLKKFRKWNLLLYWKKGYECGILKTRNSET